MVMPPLQRHSRASRHQLLVVIATKCPVNEALILIANWPKRRPSPARFGRNLDLIAASARLLVSFFVSFSASARCRHPRDAGNWYSAALRHHHHGCRITLPIALRPASTFKASAGCATGEGGAKRREKLPPDGPLHPPFPHLPGFSPICPHPHPPPTPRAYPPLSSARVWRHL